MSQSIRVLFEPLGRRAEANPGESILEAALRCGAGIRSDCGGARSCGKCRVVIENQKELTAPDSSETSLLTPEELARGLQARMRRQVPTQRPKGHRDNTT